jgi:uncharacterized protein
VDFLVYSRDGAGVESLRGDVDLLEEHWSYMDGFAESMVARGPTLAADRETPTGSLHVLGLPSVDAVPAFVANEPNNRAGVYAEHLIWRFENLLGRTMWEFPGKAEEPKFLIIARAGTIRPTPVASLPTDVRARLVVYGALMTLEGGAPDGVALALQAPGREALDALLRAARLGPDVEVHDWEFGGRG